MVCVFWALKNRKVEVSLLTHMPPCSKDAKVKNFVLSKSGRKFNPYHFGFFPLKNTQFWRFWTIFSKWVHLWPHVRPPYDPKKLFHNIFFPSFSFRFRKKKSSWHIFPSKNGHIRVSRETTLKRKKHYFKIILSKKIKKNHEKKFGVDWRQTPSFDVRWRHLTSEGQPDKFRCMVTYANIC